eukprot:scaffold276_cov132-Cylindrotheca_fusiformis.AAC.4
MAFFLALFFGIHLLFPFKVSAFHDCIEASASVRRLGSTRNPVSILSADDSSPPSSSFCAGGICIGMVNGPHEGGNASYPVAWNGTTGTFVRANMTVPGLPNSKKDQMTYYIWTDVFFGDASLGRMNQFVPQLMYGNVLDESTGPPNYRPKFHNHNETWVFGAHYYFQTFDDVKNSSQSHAAYGPLFPTWAGEILYTTFELVAPTMRTASNAVLSPNWILTMGVVGDESRISRLIVPQPYMGMGEQWDEPTTNWLEASYQNMCINACWELYGATDESHLPSTGSHYDISISQPTNSSSNSATTSYYPFAQWEVDEGNEQCPSARVTETHTEIEQSIEIDIDISPPVVVSKLEE